MRRCPGCDGRKGYSGLACGPNGSRFTWTDCEVCHGSGWVFQAVADAYWARRARADAIRRERIDSGTNLIEAARRWGMSISDYSRAERGLSDFPPVEGLA